MEAKQNKYGAANMKLLKNLHIVSDDRVIRGDIVIKGDRIISVTEHSAAVCAALEEAREGEVRGPEDGLSRAAAATSCIGDKARTSCDEKARISYDDAEVIDFGFRTLAFPGFFNSHTHLSMVLFRNYADGLPLMEWLRTKIWPIEERLTPEDIYYSSLLGMIELIRSGCTAFRDMYDHTDRIAEATIRSGLRGILGQGMIIPNREAMFKLSVPERLFEKYGGHPNLRIEVAPHAPYTCTDEALQSAKALADRLGLYLHIHLSESDDERDGSIAEYGKTPTQRLYDLGVLSDAPNREVPEYSGEDFSENRAERPLRRSRVAAAHCVKMSDADLDLLAKTGTGVLLNPSSNLKLGNGIARAKEMFERGILLSIGTDGASSNNNLDMMEELHLASLLYGLNPKDMLRAATLGGAETAGYDDLGLIREGYLADIAFLDLSGHHLTPHGDLISALCYSANSSDVSDLMAGGKFIMRNRRILTLDEEAVKAKCREIAEKLLGEKNDFA